MHRMNGEEHQEEGKENKNTSHRTFVSVSDVIYRKGMKGQEYEMPGVN